MVPRTEVSVRLALLEVLLVAVCLLVTGHLGLPVPGPEGCWGRDGLGLSCGHVHDCILRYLTLRHLEDHLHVVGAAPAADPPVYVGVGGGGDEVVLLARGELQGPGCGGEGPEGDGEVHEPPRSVAHGHNPRPRTAHSARLKLLLVHAVYHVLLLPPPLPHHGADEVDLVVLPGQVVLIDSDDHGLLAGHGRGGVPVDISHLTGLAE